MEQGYRNELEMKDGGWFRHLADIQSMNPKTAEQNQDTEREVLGLGLPDVMVTPPRNGIRPGLSHGASASPGSLLAPNGMDDMSEHLRDFKRIQRLSRNFMDEQEVRRSIHGGSPVPSFKTATSAIPVRNDSLPVTSLPYYMSRSGSAQSVQSVQQADLKRQSYRASVTSLGARHRASMLLTSPRPSATRAAGSRSSWAQLKEVVPHNGSDDVENKEGKVATEEPPSQAPAMSLGQIFKIIIPALPSKIGFVAGLILCIGSGVCTPMFSNLFSRMLSGLGAPGSINLTQTALFLLMIAGIDGFAQCGKYTIMQHVATSWIVKVQKQIFATVLNQEKAWYDDTANSPVNIVSTLVKDAEDARNIIGYVAGNLTVVLSMLLMGLIWAFAVGWQLTLVGLSLGPLFVLSTLASTRILGKYERINKRQREECARRFFQTVTNIKAIRSMSLEPVFLNKFEKSVEEAYFGGRRSAFFTGFGTGIAYFVIYVAQGET